MALRINPRLLTGQFEYHEFEETNTWAKPSYKQPILIKKARIETQLETAPMMEGVGMSKVICKAIAYAYASDTTPFLEFKERSKIETQNGIYTINRVVKVNEPFEDKLWSVELELI